MLAVNLEPGEHIADAFMAKVSLTLEIRIWSEEDWHTSPTFLGVAVES